MASVSPDHRGPDLARFAGLLADPTRATFLVALLDGRAWTASELARHAGVAPSTATEHLNRLLDAGLIGERRQGRHRYVELADPSVAELLEDLSARLPPGRRSPDAKQPISKPTGSLRASTVHEALARGRTCYDHLAGRLGVAVTDALTDLGLIDQAAGFGLTAAGQQWWVDQLGTDPALLRQTRRPVARPCLDWTERRTHLAGVAGAQLCTSLLSRGWLERIGSGRAVRVTAAGRPALRELFGADLSG